MIRVIIKGLLLFLLFNLLLGLNSRSSFGSISLYNHIFAGRPRFPFGESPREAFNFSLFNIDAMFAAHEVSAGKPKDEFRVFIIGDSSTWGTLLKPEETIAGQLNAKHLRSADGRKMRFYNLGYPTISLTKDLLILDEAKIFEPDQVIWLITLESFPRDKQLSVPLVQNNPQRSLSLVDRYHLGLDTTQLKSPTFLESTLLGRRKELADLLRLQLYGLMWTATGIDQVYPTDYPLAQVDLEADVMFHRINNWNDGIQNHLAFEPIEAARNLLNGTPLLLVNEPILISSGKNSEYRYNFYYPRWAYDQYMAELVGFTQNQQIKYLNAWDIVTTDKFTNSAIHINQAGVADLAAAVESQLLLAPMNDTTQGAK